jgi:beta-glucosidase
VRVSFVLLKNDTIKGKALLPLSKGMKIYVENMDKELVALYGTVVKSPEQADVALIRLHTPADKMKGSGLLGKLIRATRCF